MTSISSTRSRCRDRDNSVLRSGFTLFEMILVLTIIMVVGSLAAPAVDGVLARQKLRTTADELRMAWQSARLTAMRTGQAQVFRCQLGSNTYSIEPLIQPDDMANAVDDPTVISGAAAQSISGSLGLTSQAVDAETPASLQIDSTLVFLSCNAASDMRAALTLQSASVGAGSADAGQPVLFYTDGTTSTAELLIKSARDEVCGVHLRGLTGHCENISLTTLEALGGLR